MLSGRLEDWLKTMEKLWHLKVVVVVVVYARFQLEWFDWENCGAWIGGCLKVWLYVYCKLFL